MEHYNVKNDWLECVESRESEEVFVTTEEQLTGLSYFANPNLHVGFQLDPGIQNLLSMSRTELEEYNIGDAVRDLCLTHQWDTCIDHQNEDVQNESIIVILKLANRIFTSSVRSAESINETLRELINIYDVEGIIYGIVDHALRKTLMKGKQFVSYMVNQHQLVMLLMPLARSDLARKYQNTIIDIIFFIIEYKVSVSKEVDEYMVALFKAIIIYGNKEVALKVLEIVGDFLSKPRVLLTIIKIGLMSQVTLLFAHRTNVVKVKALKLISKVTANKYVQVYPQLLHIPIVYAYELLVHPNREIRKYSFRILLNLTSLNNGVVEAIAGSCLIPQILKGLNQHCVAVKHLAAKVIYNLTRYSGEADIIVLIEQNHIIENLCRFLTSKDNELLIPILKALKNMLDMCVYETSFELELFNGFETLYRLQRSNDARVREIVNYIFEEYFYNF
ncbi:uncharacterized protein LOC119687128 [Teleopsis dalmanni]|uniref:uncharacterized protein LOC119687128 n=1 Tax=Teleopsis dalmanni TaxID=139649 RepID=UPI000D32C218|nr:uncharacterized protein LOC119687128 [Teleopsis dalmanni]XP_037957261.1 uncharacterized protein LOC119687128 [Teleopsis dalmanni]XP_037957262.1 uncharacterized protein LOC119687128 [Teleopsis dalmanni]